MFIEEGSIKQNKQTNKTKQIQKTICIHSEKFELWLLVVPKNMTIKQSEIKITECYFVKSEVEDELIYQVASAASDFGLNLTHECQILI